MRHFPRLIGIILAALLSSGAAAAASMAAADWEIGPVIGGRNYSVGMPLRPSAARSGWFFDLPYPNAAAGHVHYLTVATGPLTGKREIVMRYRIDAPPGVRIRPRQFDDRPATLSLFFQRAGDNWSGRGRYETYRWYSPPASMVELAPGAHELRIRLDAGWKAVEATTAAGNPRAFEEALANAARVGFVLGSAGGRGHGVYATGPARFTVTSFEIR